VLNAGSLGVWNIMHHHLIDRTSLSQRLGFAIGKKDTLLVTYHPATRETTDSGKTTESLCRALDNFPEYNILITYPNNDPGSDKIIETIQNYAVQQQDRVKVVKSLGLTGYLSMLQYAAAVIGNSSSGIIEVPSMGIPTVDIGSRQRGRLAARSVIHCGNSTDEITEAIRKALSTEFAAVAADRVNPYFQPDTVEIIVNKILNTDLDQLIHKRFYDSALHHSSQRRQ
ncbi:MAG: UDP-N-acetylglucosamine 2-epimerase, partial [Muribaculaceae bacterium]|nr:UDP-N-acetylglucosamine 2-epimerase [Muribaculaceae bacterium]